MSVIMEIIAFMFSNSSLSSLRVLLVITSHNVIIHLLIMLFITPFNCSSVYRFYRHINYMYNAACHIAYLTIIHGTCSYIKFNFYVLLCFELLTIKITV